MKAGFKTLSVLFAATAVFAALTAPPASAVAGGTTEVDLIVDTSTWAATGCVSDDSSNGYTLVMTATGFESGPGGDRVILETSRASGNPVCAHISGRFDSDYAAVVYMMTWISIGGSTGSLTRVCAETLNSPVCTPT